MIAVSSSGRSFRALATYLATGRTGTEFGRVAWSEGRNIPTNRPELAAEIMHHTAAGRQDERIAQPVYHLAISFDLNDHPTRAQMRQVADRMLADLGLEGHQALIVAHRDRAHQHVHILVNRIHPETGRAWDRWQEKARTERSLREQEKALGFREVAGRLCQVEGRDAPERASLTNPERREKARVAEPIFVERVRSASSVFRAADSWDALETSLAERGLRLERKGQGLVITDGHREVKASRVHRDLSLRQLEARYGVRYIDRHLEPGLDRPQKDRFREEQFQTDRTRQGRTHADWRGRQRFGTGEATVPFRTAPPPGVWYVAVRIHQFERATRLEHAISAAGTALDRAEARVRAHGAAAVELASARENLSRVLRTLYRDPETAYAALAAAVDRDGAEAAFNQLRRRPEEFGPLRATEPQKGLLARIGLGGREDDSAAREVAHSAAERAARLVAAERAAPSVSSREGALASLARAQARYDFLGAEAGQLPLRGRLAANLARGVDRLSEREWVALRGTLTPREAVIAEVFRGAVRERLERVDGMTSPSDGRGAARGGTDGGSRDTPRERHIRSRMAGAAVHRVIAQLVPRELRQLARAREAVSSPGLALKRAVTRQVREAILGGKEYER